MLLFMFQRLYIRVACPGALCQQFSASMLGTAILELFQKFAIYSLKENFSGMAHLQYVLEVSSCTSCYIKRTTERKCGENSGHKTPNMGTRTTLERKITE